MPLSLHKNPYAPQSAQKNHQNDSASREEYKTSLLVFISEAQPIFAVLVKTTYNNSHQ